MAIKRLTLFLLSLSLGAAALLADDQTQSVQQALKDQGFYYGQVDGEGGPETDAAVRRFQIRNGLEVTGKLNPETLSALHLGGNSAAGDSNTVEAVPSPAPAPAEEDEASPAPPPAVVQNDHDFLRRHPAATPVPETAEPGPAAGDESQPGEVQPQPPAPAPLQAPPEAYVRFFRRTPYETAPLVVQRSTVQRAQVKLAREGMFQGVADSQPSEDLSRAIALYQRDAGMPVTGRLDMNTLAQLQLLPRREQVFPDQPVAPPDQFDEPPGRPVYRGIWVH